MPRVLYISHYVQTMISQSLTECLLVTQSITIAFSVKPFKSNIAKRNVWLFRQTEQEVHLDWEINDNNILIDAAEHLIALCHVRVN